LESRGSIVSDGRPVKPNLCIPAKPAFFASPPCAERRRFPVAPARSICNSTRIGVALFLLPGGRDRQIVAAAGDFERLAQKSRKPPAFQEMATTK
jgi:hypothetical protein